MLLPEITWGGERFYNIASIVTPNRYTRPGTDGIAVHHTVGQTEFPDKNANGTSLDEQIAHVKAINAYHVQLGYDGFGYNAIVFRDGTCMTVGQCEGARAHVANHNNHLLGIAIAGTFTDTDVPLGASLGVGRILAAAQRNYGASIVKGHRQWVTDPAWATACPGDRGINFLGQMITIRDAILAGSQAAIEAEIKRKMAEVLRENAANANLEGLAAQIKFLSKGQFCG